MKFSSKRLLAAVLAFVLVLSLFPVTQPMHVHAATALTTSVEGLTGSWEVTSTKATGASYTASGNTITGTATGGRLNTAVVELTLTNSLDSEATLKFDYALDKENAAKVEGAFLAGNTSLLGTDAASSGTYETTLAADASITIVLHLEEAKRITYILRTFL